MLPFYLQLLIVKEIFHIFLMKKIQYFFKWFLMKLVKAWMLSIINNTSQICELLFVFRFVYDYSRADWDSLHDHLRDFNFKLNASVAASKYRFFITNISSSLTHLHGLRLFFAAATVHRNLFFRLYEQNKSSESKVKFIQASNCYKKVLGAAKLAYNNTKESIFSQKLGSWGFWQIINCVFNKVKSGLHPYSMVWRCCLLHLIKQNCLLKMFLRTPILTTQLSIYLFSFLELIWNCIILL